MTQCCSAALWLPASPHAQPKAAAILQASCARAVSHLRPPPTPLFHSPAPPSPQELHAAGREALWRATLAYQPSRRLRFSTLATTCIQNVMRDVLAHPPGQPVRVSRAAQRWARQVRGAAGSLRQQRAAQQRAPEQQEQEPQEPQAGRRRRAKQAAPRPLQRLAAAAQLAPAQVEAGLAAGRRQRVASFDVRVPDAPCGARHHSTLMAALWDVQHQDTDEVSSSRDCSAALGARAAAVFGEAVGARWLAGHAPARSSCVTQSRQVA